MRRSLSPTDLAQKAFVRGLPDDISEEDIRRLFVKFGNVTEVHIAKDCESQQSRGFAFITYTSSSECSKAIDGLDGKEFRGNVLTVELASHARKQMKAGYFGGRGGRGGFRGGRGGGSPSRDGFRRGGSSFRGSSVRAGRGDFKGGYAGGRFSEERYRASSFDRDLPPRDYGSRYDSSFEYRGRSERDFLDRDYAPYRGPRDYPYAGGDRDYPPRGGRDYGYYSPPRSGREYVSSSRDYLPPSRDYPLSRAERDYDIPPRRYSGRDPFDDLPPSGRSQYEGRPSRGDYGPSPREYGQSSRYESFGGSGRGSLKSSRGSFRDSEFRGRGSASRRPPREDRMSGSGAGARRPIRSMDGPPPKKMKGGADDAGRRSPRGGGGGGGSSRRY